MSHRSSSSPWSTSLLFVFALAACGGPTKRDLLKPLQPRLSAVRADLKDALPTLPEVGSVTTVELPDGMSIDDDNGSEDDTIIIAAEALRAPSDARQDEPLEVGFAYRHRFLTCLRDTADGRQSGEELGDAAYEADCRRASEARFALVYRVAKLVPARFEQPAGGELTYEPGSVAVEWFVFALPTSGKPTRVGQFATRVVTPDTLSVEAEPNKPIDMLAARTEAAAVMSQATLAEAAKVLATKAKHVDLDPAK